MVLGELMTWVTDSTISVITRCSGKGKHQSFQKVFSNSLTIHVSNGKQDC